jgi:hypothetical protein
MAGRQLNEEKSRMMLSMARSVETYKTQHQI